MNLLLDLDDTIFDEIGFVTSGLDHIAHYIGKKYQLDVERISEFAQYNARETGRYKLFDRLCIEFGVDTDCIPSLVEQYRNHRPQIKVPVNNLNWLHQMSADFSLYLLTDGAPDVQRRKVEALGVKDYFRKIFYCQELGFSKPSKEGLNKVLSKIGLTTSQIISIGDDPIKDQGPASALNIKFIRINNGKYKNWKVDNNFPTFASLADVNIDDIVI